MRLGRGASGRERQGAIIRELVETRDAELRRAYPDLLGLGYGIGTAQGRDKPTPCVMFLVTRKAKRVAADRRLPSHLFTYWTYRGRRVLCAVPTDVEEQRAYREVVAHAPESLAVSSGAVGPISGRLTSPVRISRIPGLFVLSCLHVLGMVQQFYPGLGPSCEFRPAGGDRRIGVLSGYRGCIEEPSPEHPYSFDAALGTVDDDAVVRSMLARVLPANWPTEMVLEPQSIPNDALILSDREIEARLRTTWRPRTLRVTYDTPAGRIEVEHSGLIEWDASTQRGDSGSPVVARDRRDLLLGMHIAGDGSTAVMIPAFELFRPVRLGLPERVKLSIPNVLDI